MNYNEVLDILYHSEEIRHVVTNWSRSVPIRVVIQNKEYVDIETLGI